MITFFWIVGYILMVLPVVLSLFSIFLILTYRVSEEEIFDDGSWGQDIDVRAKNQYNSNTYGDIDD